MLLTRWMSVLQGTGSIYVWNRWPGQPSPAGSCQYRMRWNQPFLDSGPRNGSTKSGSTFLFVAMFCMPSRIPNVLEADGGAWSFGRASWRCLGFIALATASAMLGLSERKGVPGGGMKLWAAT